MPVVSAAVCGTFRSCYGRDYDKLWVKTEGEWPPGARAKAVPNCYGTGS